MSLEVRWFATEEARSAQALLQLALRRIDRAVGASSREAANEELRAARGLLDLVRKQIDVITRLTFRGDEQHEIA